MAARTLPGVGLKAGYATGEDGWGDDVNLDLLKASVLLQAGVKSRLAAVPGAPADGDIHILTAAPNAQKIAVRDNGAWVYLTPLEGWWVYDQGTNEYLTFDGAAWSVFEAGGGGSGVPDGGTTGQVLTKISDADGDADWADSAGGGGGGGSSDLYRFGSFFTTMPAADEVVMLHVATDDFSLPADLAGSVFKVGTNPSGTVVLTLYLNDDEIGTASITAGGVVTLDGDGGDVVAGDLLALVAPADSLGLANTAFTFRGDGVVSGGSGGVAVFFDNPIDVPPDGIIWGDEFDGDALDGSWSQGNQTSNGITMNYTFDGDSLHAVPTAPQDGWNFAAILKDRPVGDFDIVVKAGLDGFPTGYNATSLGFFNSANGKFNTISFHARADGSFYTSFNRWNNYNSYNTDNSYHVAGPYGYLRLKLVGTTITAYYSNFGREWEQIGTESLADFVGADFDKIGLFTKSENTTKKVHGIYYWIRDYGAEGPRYGALV